MSIRTCDRCAHRKVCRLWGQMLQAVVAISWGIPSSELRPKVAQATGESCPEFEDQEETVNPNKEQA